MDVLIVLVFVSLLLVCGGILLLCVSMHQRDFEHADRLSLLPLTDGPPARPRDGAERPADAPASHGNRTQRTGTTTRP